MGKLQHIHGGGTWNQLHAIDSALGSNWWNRMRKQHSQNDGQREAFYFMQRAQGTLEMFIKMHFIAKLFDKIGDDRMEGERRPIDCVQRVELKKTMRWHMNGKVRQSKAYDAMAMFVFFAMESRGHSECIFFFLTPYMLIYLPSPEPTKNCRFHMPLSNSIQHFPW